MEKPAVIIRQANIDDKENLFKFYSKVYGELGQYKYPLRWEWLYLNNPYLDHKRIPIWIALINNKIVGHTGAMIVPCYIKGEYKLGGWSVDTIVTKEARGYGIGKRLQEANQAFNPIFMSLSYSVINLKIKTKLGALASKEFNLYRKINRLSTNLLFGSLKTKLIQSFGDFFGYSIWCILFYSGFLFLLKSLIQFYFKKKITQKEDYSNLDFKPINGEFDEKATVLWNNIKNNVDFQVVRDAKYLNWKFVEQPLVDFKKFYIYDNNELQSILVLRLSKHPEPKIGAISEIISRDYSVENIEKIISFAMDFFHKHQMETVMCLSSNSVLNEVMCSFGFIVTKTERMMAFFKNDEFSQREFTNANINFTLGDHDLDQYPRARTLTFFELIKIVLKKNDK